VVVAKSRGWDFRTSGAAAVRSPDIEASGVGDGPTVDGSEEVRRRLDRGRRAGPKGDGEGVRKHHHKEDGDEHTRSIRLVAPGSFPIPTTLFELRISS
jgi:hypothetical protein